MKVAGFEEKDVRLWDHEPLLWQRWVRFERALWLQTKVERTLDWCDANGWELRAVYPDDTCEFRAHGKTFTVPGRP